MKLYTADAIIGEDRMIGVRRHEERFTEDLHSHDFIEIIYIRDGEVDEYVDNVKYSVKRGDMIFINRGAQHAFTTESGFWDTEIFFSPKVVEDGIITPQNALALLSLTAFNEMRKDQNGGIISFRGEERKEVEFILSAMVNEYNNSLVSSQSVIASYLSILFTKMLRKAEMAEGDSIINDVWQDLKRYIEENSEKHMTLASLATKSFYNPSYFSRVFKQKFGASPTEYIRECRINRALELLQHEDLSVDEIISKVGFTDRSSFYHSFAKRTGLTPAEYRAKHKG